MKNSEPGNFELMLDGDDVQSPVSTLPTKPKTPKKKVALKETKTEVAHPQAKLEFLRMDHTHCMIPGLIRSLKDGDRKKYKLHVKHVVGGNTYIIKGSEPLSGLDLKVFYGLAALALKTPRVLTANPTTERGIKLRSQIQLKGPAADERVMVVDDSYYRLAIEIGYKDVNNANVLRESVLRWWDTGIIHIDENKKLSTYRIIDSLSSDESTSNGTLFVTLNPLATKAILGGKSRYVRMMMTEIRQLQGDPAIIMHSKFCAMIRPGYAHDYMIDTLINYVWFDVTDNVNTRKKRKISMKEGLAELEALGWKCTPYSGGRKYNIRRPYHAPEDGEIEDGAAPNSP